MDNFLPMYRVYDCDMCGCERNAENDRYGVVGMDKVICKACCDRMTEQQMEFEFVKEITGISGG